MIDRDYWLDFVLTELSIEQEDSGMSEEEFNDAIRVAVDAEIDSISEDEETDYRALEDDLLSAARRAVGL